MADLADLTLTEAGGPDLPIPEEQGAPIPQYDQMAAQYRSALQMVDDIVLKNYVTQLDGMEILPLDREVLSASISESVRIFRITEMVYQKDEYATYKFASVFNALSAVNGSVFIMMDSDGVRTDFYMGVRSMDEDRTPSSVKDTLKKALMGQFPGVKIEDRYMEEDIAELLSDIKAEAISAVTCVGNSKDGDSKDNRTFIQGLEKLAEAMRGERYTGIVLANITGQDQLSQIRRGYESIYTQLSPFAGSQVSYATNSSVNLSKSLSMGSTKGTSYTQNTSETNSTGTSETTGTSDSTAKINAGSRVVKGLAATAGVVGAALSPFTFGASLAIGGIASAGLGALGEAISSTKTTGTSTSSGVTQGNAVTEGESRGTTEAETETETDTRGVQSGTSQNRTLTLQDKSILDILERIDLQIKRLSEFESLGMWECAAYFLSESSSTAEIAAATYKALMSGENSGVEVAAVNSWDRYAGEKTPLLGEYITRFIHPVFVYDNPWGKIPVTPCAMVSGNELALHMGLPRHSVCGFPVIEHAAFGKEAVSYHRARNGRDLLLGKGFHMGSDYGNDIRLDRDSLAMHAFVTGTTGSGKSNTVYEMLRQLNSAGVPFLVIEPAKGEYKQVFGHQDNVSVLGTNPACSELLHINPFRFPKGIHILEHVDRLVEIFNVCWPMYAAMPAVLKDAVLQAYEACGWDLAESANSYSDQLFPTFFDLQTELVDVIEHSAYSQELKSNYMGSLLTRVKSLTNGLNGMIFAADETDSQVLFDRNAIVDLSRVGSQETKALIMGVLIIRLHEYRMTSGEGMNQPLRHMVVLEEAHNLLKRTSTEQNPESPSLAGKSVEMLSGAIAEMRTYGQGFLIVDQSPGALDISAIRNTNTKIILRLPEESDRRVAGKSAALRDDQLDEISKMPRGVAVVYQNDWLEPVLCRVRKYPGEEREYVFHREGDTPCGDHRDLLRELARFLMKTRVLEPVQPQVEQIRAALDSARLSTKNKLKIHQLLREYEGTGELHIWEGRYFDRLSRLTCELLDCRGAIEQFARTCLTFEELSRELAAVIDRRLGAVSSELQLALSQCIMKEYSMGAPEKVEIYAAWQESVKANGGLL